MTTYEPEENETIIEVAKKMIDLSKSSVFYLEDFVKATLNGIEIIVSPNSRLNEVVGDYYAEFNCHQERIACCKRYFPSQYEISPFYWG
ncbi:MAG: hypothetical protein WCW87_02545 [Candidatus Paceibacterota bacterium]